MSREEKKSVLDVIDNILPLADATRLLLSKEYCKEGACSDDTVVIQHVELTRPRNRLCIAQQCWLGLTFRKLLYRRLQVSDKVLRECRQVRRCNSGGGGRKLVSEEIKDMCVCVRWFDWYLVICISCLYSSISCRRSFTSRISVSAHTSARYKSRQAANSQARPFTESKG